jgi:hypothetical protein
MQARTDDQDVKVMAAGQSETLTCDTSGGYDGNNGYLPETWSFKATEAYTTLASRASTAQRRVRAVRWSQPPQAPRALQRPPRLGWERGLDASEQPFGCPFASDPPRRIVLTEL